MKPQSARSPFIIAGLLVLLLVALTAAPASAANVRRAPGAEDLAARLVNCLRSGGRITLAGTCKGWGSGRLSAERAPLQRSPKIADQVAWPWAKRTVKLGSQRSCWVGHSLSRSTVDSRFRAAGLRSDINGESVGCGAYDPKRTVVFILRLWQRERLYGGWHWRQLKDKSFKSMGVAVARRGQGKSQVVVNFYGKADP